MKLGLIAPKQNVREKSAREIRDETLRVVKTADDVGFDLIIAGQHYLADYKQFQTLPFLARLTGEVKSANIATGIVLLPFYHPIEIAEQIATIDALHDNRTILGVGAGYRDVEYDAFGIPKSERVPRLIEGLQLTQRLLSEEEVTYDGDFYSVSDATIPIRPDDPIPVWLAANSNRAVERAAKMADGWYVNPHSTITEIKEQKREYYDPVREERNESTGVPVFREAFVAPTHEEAVETAREHLWEKYQRYIDWGQDEAMEDTEDLHRPFEELADDRFLLGTPAEVCAQIESYEEELNASHLIVRTHWPGMDYDDAIESVELLGDEVIPNV